MFALSRLGARPLQVSLKCQPLLAEELRAAHAAVLPGYHLNKRHWNTVTIDRTLPAQMIEDSYDLVVSRLPELAAARWGGKATTPRPGSTDTGASRRATAGRSSRPCRCSLRDRQPVATTVASDHGPARRAYPFG
jgi:hypothetical protein